MTIDRYRQALALGALLIGGLPFFSYAATIKVPSQELTIQAAIDAAQNSDTIAVAPGAYKEDLDFKGKSITLIGTGGASQTILTGAGAPYVLTFQNAETRATLVTGFTLRNMPGTSGALVYASGASPSLADDVFEPGVGTAIWGFNTSFSLQRSELRGALCNGSPFFGVVWFVNASTPTIKDNAFYNNKCSALYISLPATYTPDIANNTIVGNETGIYVDARVDEHTVLLRNNIISANHTGMWVENLVQTSGLPTFQNNLVYGNVTDYQGMPDQTGLNGNISADPKLGGVNIGEFHPDPGSPVIDRGIASAVDVNALDLYGLQRVRAGSSGVPVVDIGAAEYVGIPPTATMQASATAVPLGSAVALTWNSTGADSCAASGAWTGSLPLTGNRQVTPQVGNNIYILSCSNSAASRGRSLTVNAVTAPTVQLSADATSITEFNLDTIRWSSTNATSCTKTGSWSGSAAPSGSLVVSPSAGTYSFTLTCTGLAGSAASTLKLMVLAIPKIDLRLSQTDVPLGGTTVLTWSVLASTTSCTGSGSWSGPIPASGSLLLTASTTDLKSYTLTCTGAGGTTQSTVSYRGYGPPQSPYVFRSLALGTVNVQAFALPGTPGATGVGLDNHGYAYDASTLGSQITWSGQTFVIGTVNGVSALSRVTVPLSDQTQVLGLSLLATGSSGNQPNQTFVITYTDGTTTQYTQSLSDWGSPQNYPGESIAAIVPSRVTPSGTLQKGAWHIYGYFIPLDPSKVALSLTLPKTRNVTVLAINANFSPQLFAPYLGSNFNITAIASPGLPASNGGVGSGYAYDGSVLPKELLWNGYDFILGSANELSGVTKSTLPLYGRAASITILVAAVNGNQINQPFVVTYGGGGTTVFTQSISDWGSPQGYPGESIVTTLPTRITPTGAKQAGKWRIYSYTFTPNSANFIQSLTLPQNRNVIVLGVGVKTIN